MSDYYTVEFCFFIWLIAEGTIVHEYGSPLLTELDTVYFFETKWNTVFLLSSSVGTGHDLVFPL
jgi:hypothetical protein